MEHDNAGLLKHLDELIEDSRRAFARIAVQGGKGSSAYSHQQGVTRGLGQARQAVAEWLEEEKAKGNTANRRTPSE
jgi:hypothetical protein